MLSLHNGQHASCSQKLKGLLRGNIKATTQTHNNPTLAEISSKPLRNLSIISLIAKIEVGKTFD
ncbi:CLUMA_CG002792, isoform A [Clunio marinus]|uniref:CLUMA_CG002792, isoform A n=1 Tax=Clunio marinus TaxID=568069 RepID=A0A1J1HLY6_9DIPT|nr:CLUMA_CG002792, isoform A [Clunio marinus]